MNRSQLPTFVPLLAARTVGPGRTSSPAAATPATGQGRKVLVVCDQPHVLQALARVLEDLDADAQILEATTALPDGTDAPQTCRTNPRAMGLSERQVEVLRCMLQGMPNKLISRRLSIAQGTVKIHVSAILRALHVRNRTQAVVAAGRLGFTIDRAHGGIASNSPRQANDRV